SEMTGITELTTLDTTSPKAGDGELTTLDTPSPAFGVLERGFHPHAQGVDGDKAGPTWQIRDQEPRFFKLRVPTSRQRTGKAVFFPQEDISIPRCAFREEEVAATLPVA